jgi:hypothetical protein
VSDDHRDESEVPAWVTAEVQRWRDLLRLHEYLVTVQWEPITQEVPDGLVDGETTTHSRYLRAYVHLDPRSVEETGHGRHIIRHEVTHVFFGEIGAFIGHLINLLPRQVQNFALDAWGEVHERTTERLTRVLEMAIDTSKGDSDERE